MIKKHIFVIILFIFLIVFNFICYKYNGRLLHLSTNLLMIFLIVVNSIAYIKNDEKV